MLENYIIKEEGCKCFSGDFYPLSNKEINFSGRFQRFSFFYRKKTRKKAEKSGKMGFAL